MKARIGFVIAAAWAAILMTGGIAQAQDSALSRAEGHFNKAQVLHDTGSYDEAAVEFLAAYQARDLPEFLFNAAVCYEKLAKATPSNIEAWNKAIEYYRKYLGKELKARDKKSIKKRLGVLEAERDRIKTDLDAKKSDDSQAEAVKTSAQVEALEDVAIRGLVVIESDPPDANIYLDDKAKGPLSKTPWSGTIEGEHTVFIERRGYKPVEKRISPSPDKLLVLSFSLAEEDYLGWIDIRANVPGADIYLDDKSVGVYSKTPFSGNLKPGKHKVWITADGYDEYYQEIQIDRGQTHSIDAKLEGSPVGYLNIRGEGIEDTTIYVDGEVLCERGPCRKAVKEGSRQVEVRRSGYKTFSRQITMQARTEHIVKVRLAKKPGRSDAVWAYIFSAAFAGGGVFLSLQAQGIHDDLSDEISAGTPPPDGRDSRFQRGKIFTVGADAAYALATVTLITAIYYTFRDKGPPSRGTIDVRAVALEPTLNPQVGPGYAGLGMEWRW